jgi:hypothetical protein
MWPNDPTPGDTYPIGLPLLRANVTSWGSVVTPS